MKRRGGKTRRAAADAEAPEALNKSIKDYYNSSDRNSPEHGDDAENSGIEEPRIASAKMHRGKRGDVLSPSRMGNIGNSSPKTPDLSAATKAMALSPVSAKVPLTSASARALASLRTLSPNKPRTSQHVFGGAAVIGSLSPPKTGTGCSVVRKDTACLVSTQFDMPRHRLFRDAVKAEKGEAAPPLHHTPPTRNCPSPHKHAKTHVLHTTRKGSSKSLSGTFSESNCNGADHDGFMAITSDEEGECSITAEVSMDNNNTFELTQHIITSITNKVSTPAQVPAIKSAAIIATPKPTMLDTTQNRLSHYSPSSNSSKTVPPLPNKRLAKAASPPARRSTRQCNQKQNNAYVDNRTTIIVQEMDDSSSEEDSEWENSPVKTKKNAGVKKMPPPKPSNGVTKNPTITEFFPAARRSVRKSEKEIKREEEMLIQLKIKEHCEEGLEVVEFPEKGRGIMAKRDFKKSEFVVEYVGELLNCKEALEREDMYAQDPSKGCYMYFFACGGERWCLDGTEESGYLGRLLNHSRLQPNCRTQAMMVDGNPHLVLLAAKDIAAGTELVYDYGDRSKEALVNHPWLAF